MKSKCCNSDLIEFKNGFYCKDCGDTCEVDPFVTIKIKPMSVNELYLHKAIRNRAGKWIATRIKTGKYRAWQKEVHYLLPSGLKFEGKLKLNIILAYSSANSDTDNGVKAIQDSLQTKYGFNDNKIFHLDVQKILVKKGEEYFRFHLHEIDHKKPVPKPEQKELFNPNEPKF